MELGSQESPGEMKSREVELDSHSRILCLAAKLFLNSCFSGTVFVTLLRAAVETAVRAVHKLLNSHWRSPHLFNIVILTLAGGQFGLDGSECPYELFVSSTSPPFPRP